MGRDDPSRKATGTLDGFGQGNLQGGEDGRKLLARNERICKADVNMAQK